MEEKKQEELRKDYHPGRESEVIEKVKKPDGSTEIRKTKYNDKGEEVLKK